MKKLVNYIAIIGIIGMVSPLSVFAQSKISAPINAPKIILTWQANSYVPASYQGKVLPPRDSSVNVYLEFIDNGKIIPVEKQMIKWEVNGRFLASEQGLNRISFQLNQFTAREYVVTATIKEYNGADIAKSILIRRADPMVLIESPATEKTTTGIQTTFFAKPYYFSSLNVSDYLFNWKINNTDVEGKLAKLLLSIPNEAQNQIFTISATVANRNNEIEAVTTQKKYSTNN